MARTMSLRAATMNFTPWGDEAWCCQCGTEGMACSCNPTHEMPPGTTVIAETDGPPGEEH